MLVYNTIFKVMKHHMVQIIIALTITIFFSLAMTASDNSNQESKFTESSLNIGIINLDSDTLLLNGLIQIVTEKNDLYNLSNDDNVIQDALYFRQVDYVLIIPENYTVDFFSNKDVSLEKRTIDSSFAAVNMDMTINKYLNLFQLYQNTTNLSQEEIIEKIKVDLSQTVDLAVVTSPLQKTDSESAKYYFNYLSYTILSGFTVCIATILLVFHKFDLKRRITCSPISLTKLNFQLFSGILTFGLAIMLIMLAIGFLLFPSTMTSLIGVMFTLNLFAFMVVGMSFSLFLSQIANNSEILGSITTVVSLGTSFLCGVFIPTELLSEPVIKIAKFLPSYWYVSSNEQIDGLTNFTVDSLAPIFQNLLVQLAFAFALFAIALLVSKQKIQAES